MGDPVGADISPHGGYSSTTDYCLQCHGVHGGSEYALMTRNNVVATCNTCHAIGGTSATGAIDPGIVGTTPGTASQRAAYTVTNPVSGHDPNLSGNVTHDPDSSITITQLDPFKTVKAQNYTTPAGSGTSTGTGGLYCASCHSPHGDKGMTVNTQKVWTTDPLHAGTTGDPYVGLDKDGRVLISWANGVGPTSNVGQLRSYTSVATTGNTSIKFGWASGGVRNADATANTAAYAYLHLDASVAGGTSAWEICGTTTPTVNAGAIDGTNSAPDICRYAQATDSSGLPVSLYAYKMLSSGPNHTYGAVYAATDASGNPTGATGNLVRSYAVGGSDSAGWCGTCHNPRLDSDFGIYGASATNHDHPTSCTTCHGNETTYSGANGTVTGTDFPHTSSNNALLKGQPDGLCVSCHLGSGSLLP